jgi:flagellar hook-length control protein FliK
MVMRTSQSGSSEIRLRLNPDNLGEVTLKLTVNGSSISANLVAQNGDVRNALLSNHQQLAQSLSEAGLTLAGFSVDVSGGDAGRDQNRDRTGGFGRRYVVHEIGGNTDASEPAQSPSLGPPLLANSSLELFNYLA